MLAYRGFSAAVVALLAVPEVATMVKGALVCHRFTWVLL